MSVCLCNNETRKLCWEAALFKLSKHEMQTLVWLLLLLLLPLLLLLLPLLLLEKLSGAKVIYLPFKESLLLLLWS